MRMASLWRSGALCAVLALVLPEALASTADVQNLIRQGQYSKALEHADSLLAAQPKDAQLRFLKGIALTELGRPNEAVDVFQALTAEFPELPEPYNNLAVLYAQQRQFEKARASLEMAIRTHPAYATAHENLGDVYSRLASQAYNKALQIDASNTTAQTKLALIRELITATSKGGSPSQVAAVRDVKPAAVATPLAVATPPATVPTPAEPRKTVPVAAPKPEPTPAAAAPAGEERASDEAAATVKAWASAWSRKDFKSYLAFYADDFAVPGGRPRAAWEGERRERVTKPGRISVEVSDIRVDLRGSEATVRFRQNYSSDTFDASANKSLLLVRKGEQWRIRREAVGG